MYKVYKTTPSMRYPVANFSTLADARDYLKHVRREYAKDAPRGEKCRCRWIDSAAIRVKAGGDEIIYRAIKTGA